MTLCNEVGPLPVQLSQDQLLLNAGQKYCRMLQWKHSAILPTFIKLPSAIKTFVLSIFSGRLSQDLLYMAVIQSDVGLLKQGH